MKLHGCCRSFSIPIEFYFSFSFISILCSCLHFVILREKGVWVFFISMVVGVLRKRQTRLREKNEVNVSVLRMKKNRAWFLFFFVYCLSPLETRERIEIVVRFGFIQFLYFLTRSERERRVFNFYSMPHVKIWMGILKFEKFINPHPSCVSQRPNSPT